MIRLTSVCGSLSKETIEDGILYAFYLFGRREPVLSRGNPHWKELGKSFYVHLPHPSLAFLSCERELFPSYPTAFCGFPAVVLLSGAVVPLVLGAYQF